MKQIFDLIMNFMDMYIVYIIFGIVLKKKELPLHFMLFSFIFGSFLIFLTGLIFDNNLIILWISFAILLATTFLYENKFIYKIIITVIFFVLGAISESIGYLILQLMKKVFIRKELTDELTFIIIFMTSRIILFSLAKAVNFMIKSKNNIIKLHYMFIILLTPTLCIILIYFLVPYGIDNNIQLSSATIIPIVCILAIILSVTYLFENILDKFELERKAFYLNKELKSQQTNYEKTSVFFRQIAKMVHDTNYHLHYITSCINNKQYDESLNYMNRILEAVNSGIVIINSGNPLIDSLLSNTINVAKEHGVETSYEIQLLNSEMHIETFDLCIILGNALDNAIEACRKIPDPKERFLNIKITSDKDNLIIKIENSADKEIKAVKEGLISEKNNKFAHGIGLENIQNTVNKYNGELLIEASDERFYFAVLLPLQKLYV